MVEIPKNPPPGKDDATSADYQCEVEIPGLDQSSIETAERRHVIAEFLDYFSKSISTEDTQSRIDDGSCISCGLGVRR